MQLKSNNEKNKHAVDELIFINYRKSSNVTAAYRHNPLPFSQRYNCVATQGDDDDVITSTCHYTHRGIIVVCIMYAYVVMHTYISLKTYRFDFCLYIRRICVYYTQRQRRYHFRFSPDAHDDEY